MKLVNPTEYSLKENEIVLDEITISLVGNIGDEGYISLNEGAISIIDSKIN